MRAGSLVRIGGCIITLLLVHQSGRISAGAQLPCTQVPSVTPCLQSVPAPAPTPRPSTRAPATPLAGAAGAKTQAPAQALAAARNFEAEAAEAERKEQFKEAFELYLSEIRHLPAEPARPWNYWRRGPQPDFWFARDRAKNRLMTSVIRVARYITPPPEIPAAARRALDEGKAAMAKAQTAAGYGPALGPFETAVDLAPWWPAPHLALSIVWDALGNYTDAANSLDLYFFAAPEARSNPAQHAKSMELRRKQRDS